MGYSGRWEKVGRVWHRDVGDEEVGVDRGEGVIGAAGFGSGMREGFLPAVGRRRSVIGS